MRFSPKLFSGLRLCAMFCSAMLCSAMLCGESPPRAQTASAPFAVSPAPRLLGNTPKAVTALLFSPDATKLAVGSMSQIKFFDLQSGEASRDFYLGGVPVTALAWSPDAKFLVVGGAAGKDAVQFVDAATGKVQKVIDLPTAPTALCFSPDGQQLVIAGADENLRFYDLATATVGPALSGFKFPAYALAFAPDGKNLIAVGGGFPYLERRNRFWWYRYPGWLRIEGEITTIDLATRTIAHQQPVPFGSSNCAITPDARTVAFAGGYAEADYMLTAIDEDFETRHQWGLVYHLNQARWMFRAQPDAGDYVAKYTLGEAALGAPPVRNARGRRVRVPSKIGALDIGIGVAGVVNTIRDVNEDRELGARLPPVGALTLSPSGNFVGLPAAKTPILTLWNGDKPLDSHWVNIGLNTVSVAAFAPNGSSLALASGNAVFFWSEK